MTVSYLDVDDEITDAVARLRTAEDRRFILVLPPGSRVATSRINFRLLAKEGHERGVTVGLVSGEAGVRALAISAGMPAYGSVSEAEASLPRDEPAHAPSAPLPPDGVTSDTTAVGVQPMADQARRVAATHEWPATDQRAAVAQPSAIPPTAPASPPPPPPPPTSPRSAAGASVRSGAPLRSDMEGTRVLPRSSVSGATPYAGSPVTHVPPPGWETEGWFEPSGSKVRRGSGGRTAQRFGGWAVRLAIVGALLVGAAYLAYITLPNVTITVEPETLVAGPLTVEVVADRSVAVADPATGAVPAVIVDIPLSATDEFDATGQRIEETRATGRVVLSSENTVSVVVVVAGTRIETASGVVFETLEDATVPEADFDTGTPGRTDVRVRAVRAGPAGNVPADTVTRLPAEYSDQRVEATNPNATSGGERQEVAVVTSEDYDAALATLEERLDAQLEAAVSDPDNTPTGLVAYPETAEREEATAEPTATDLVDQAMETFTLTAESIGTILAVDESVVSQVASDQLAETIPTGARLFADTVQADLGRGEVVDGRIEYRVIVSGEQYMPPDPASLLASVRGRSVSDADVILSEYGTVVIRPWPDFIGSVPDDPRRINLTILEPQRSTP